MKVYVYIITSPSGKKYIGITNNISNRKSAHKHNTFKTNIKSKLYDAMRVYGFENFVWEIFSIEDSWENACKKEIELIKEMDTINSGYNISFGGEAVMAGRHHSLSTVEKMKKDIRRSHPGKENGMFGKKISEEHKKIISEANKGKVLSEQTIQKIKIKRKDQIFSEETKQKISRSHIGLNAGDKNPMSIKSISERYDCSTEEAKSIRLKILKRK